MPTPSRIASSRLVRAAVTAAALAAATAAYAHWSTTGSGAATAAVAQAATVSIAPTAPSAALYPGGSAGVAVRIVNVAPGAARVHALALDASRGHGGFDVDAAHAACDVSALSFATVTGDWTVPGSGTLSLELADALTLAYAAPDACQGATFTVYLQAS